VIGGKMFGETLLIKITAIKLSHSCNIEPALALSLVEYLPQASLFLLKLFVNFSSSFFYQAIYFNALYLLIMSTRKIPVISNNSHNIRRLRSML
jgi:hypothetical protein